MGIGSYLTKYVKKELLNRFILIEIILGFFGGFSSLILYTVFVYAEDFYYIYGISIIGIIGTLIGLEIPIVSRIINFHHDIKDTLAKVLSFDYVGALIASLVFPLLMLPFLGLLKSAFFIGILNMTVALITAFIFRNELINKWRYVIISSFFIIVLLCGWTFSRPIDRFFEQNIYQDKIIFSTQSPYQKIVVTKWRNDLRLYINGSLQFASIDEYRYHEPLVHIPMLLNRNNENVIILGGGDGLALREILKHNDVKKVTLVDLDQVITSLAKNNRIFSVLNKNSMRSEKVTVVNTDAYDYIKDSEELYNTIIIDLPDPKDSDLGKLYSKEFYMMIKKRLAVDGIIVTQATSPFFARQVFWCIHNTCSAVFEKTIAYNVYVPSFGQWGFVMCFNDLAIQEVNTDSVINKLNQALEKSNYLELRYLDANFLSSLFVFDKDTEKIDTDTNFINNQVIINYYEKSIESWR